MNAGLLKHRITLKALSSTGNQFTDDAQEYSDVASRWAAFRPVSSKEVSAGSGEVLNTDVVFTLRYEALIAPISNKWRIVHQGNTYEVTGVLPLEDNRWIKASARRMS